MIKFYAFVVIVFLYLLVTFPFDDVAGGVVVLQAAAAQRQNVKF